ncbi:ABC transporter permease [Dactylosporangium sp. CA-233914]|uniref:ABC transporter permease n=1 Tax=Dactylosporangium sp. CA-233914 TaxID=3239934 RepID=UPI003D8B409C
MKDVLTISKAIALGFSRDKAGLFFTVAFPLVFLFIMGGLFGGDGGTARASVIQIGEVAVLDSMTADAHAQIDKVLDVKRGTDLDTALAKVRKGEAAAAVEQRGNTVVVHYSTSDQAAAGTVRGVMQSLVQSANLAGSNTPPAFGYENVSVDTTSVKPIQTITPGLLGWAIATGATFTAASTLVGWRQRRFLRRLTLCPISMGSVVGARLLVSVGIALVQTALFIAVAALFFGLPLQHDWWATIPLVLAGTLAFLAIGLLAGARLRSVDAAGAVANLLVIPMAFLSGSFFSLTLAPNWLQTVSRALPLRYLNDSMTAVLSHGEPAWSVVPQFGLLLGFAAVVTVVAVRLFRWDDV